jgi:hypothetical protein
MEILGKIALFSPTLVIGTGKFRVWSLSKGFLQISIRL